MSMNNKIGRKARSVFYIIFISGLLSLTSWIVEILWDLSLYKFFNLSQISFLESVGIVSFVYIIYFGIKFGEASWQNDMKTEKMSERESKTDKMSDNNSGNKKRNDANPINPEILRKLPEEDRQELKNLVSKCCGMPINDNPLQSSFHRRIEHLDG